jgi:hypothetical protein
MNVKNESSANVRRKRSVDCMRTMIADKSDSRRSEAGKKTFAAYRSTSVDTEKRSTIANDTRVNMRLVDILLTKSEYPSFSEDENDVSEVMTNKEAYVSENMRMTKIMRNSAMPDSDRIRARDGFFPIAMNPGRLSTDRHTSAAETNASFSESSLGKIRPHFRNTIPNDGLLSDLKAVVRAAVKNRTIEIEIGTSRNRKGWEANADDAYGAHELRGKPSWKRPGMVVPNSVPMNAIDTAETLLGNRRAAST